MVWQGGEEVRREEAMQKWSSEMARGRLRGDVARESMPWQCLRVSYDVILPPPLFPANLRLNFLSKVINFSRNLQKFGGGLWILNRV